jgi:signal transduction histidine kinase
MRDLRPIVRAAARSRITGYTAAAVLPVMVTYAVFGLSLPPFVFEHLVVLLVLAVAIPWGLGPAVVTAAVSVLADNVLLREPVGVPTISGYRDVLDLGLFACVAVVVSMLVRRAHHARRAAEEAAERERRARDERDRLVAMVTHDLATPLSVLRGTVQFVRNRGIQPESDLPRLLARLETASARASSLVRTLADARALDSAEFSLHLQIADLREIVMPIVDMMDRFSERHPVVLDAPESPVLVRADGHRLQTVVENLVSNAIKYSPEGGAVEVSIRSEPDHAVLCVCDRGIGISPEALPHIFERSYRAPEAAASVPGLGLGLSIAAQVVARHGGTIEASPKASGGTEFSVRLPRVPSSAALRPQDAARQPVAHT